MSCHAEVMGSVEVELIWAGVKVRVTLICKVAIGVSIGVSPRTLTLIQTVTLILLLTLNLTLLTGPASFALSLCFFSPHSF